MKENLRCRECGIILPEYAEDDICECCKDDRRDNDEDND